MEDSGSKNNKISLQKNLSHRVSINHTHTKSSLLFPDPEAQQYRRRPCCYGFREFYNTFCAFASLIMVVFSFLLLLVAVGYFSFLHSHLPEVHLHRLDVNNLQTETTKLDTLLTANLQVQLNATNRNDNVGLSYTKMFASITTEGLNLGTQKLDTLNQDPDTTSDITVQTSVKRMPVLGAAANELIENSNSSMLMIDVVVRGHIEFLEKSKHIMGFPISIFCINVDQSELDKGNPHSCAVRLNPFH